MSDRKITIKLDEKNLLDVIEELRIAKTKKKFWKPDEIYLTLDLPDTKNTYEYLTRSKKILDWSLGEYKEFQEGYDIPEVDSSPVELEEHPSTIKKKKRDKELEKVALPKSEEPKEEKKEIVDKFTQFILDLVRKDGFFTGLSYFIEATWKVCRKSPGIIFGTPLFKSSFEKEYEETKNTVAVERALLDKVIESYYSGVSELNTVLDIEDKIRTKWKILSQCETLTSVSITLFRNA